MSMTDITSPYYRAVREQAHDDAESCASDTRYPPSTAFRAALREAESRGSREGTTEYQEYTLWFEQVWKDWRKYHGHCTHSGGHLL